MNNTQGIGSGDKVVIGNGKTEWLVLIVKDNGVATLMRNARLKNGTTRHYNKEVSVTDLTVVKAKKAAV